ncbi:MAG: nuclear transport factor 2 family protein, partial [Acidimicrobiia bacterium]
MDEPADRAALRQLVEAYAHGVDRREPEAVAALFCEDGVLAIYEGDPD